MRNMLRTITQSWLAAITTVLVVAGSASSANAQRHPHFDDGGTLVWQTTLAAGQEAARKADKIIFVEVGAKT